MAATKCSPHLLIESFVDDYVKSESSVDSRNIPQTNFHKVP